MSSLLSRWSNSQQWETGQPHHFHSLFSVSFLCCLCSNFVAVHCEDVLKKMVFNALIGFSSHTKKTIHTKVISKLI